MPIDFWRKALVLVGALAFANFAHADPIEGNDCSGVFGQGFENCKIPAEYDLNQSPIVIKFNFNDDGSITTSINSGLFPTIDGSEFSIVFGAGGSGMGTWTYTPGAGDPGINWLVAKGGPNFNLFSTGGLLSGSYATPINPNNGTNYGLSHMSFYDTRRSFQVPEPASILLLGIALASLSLTTRRRRR